MNFYLGFETSVRTTGIGAEGRRRGGKGMDYALQDAELKTVYSSEQG